MRNRLMALGFRLPGRAAETGLSLVEATVILGVVSMLTAVLAPSVRSYVGTAQQAAAKRDVEVIGSALSRLLADLGEAWVLRDGTQGTGSTATNHITPLHTSGNRVDLLVTDGLIPAVNTARSSGSPDWNTEVCSCPGTPTGVQKLEWFLVLNTPSADAAKKFRTADGLTNTLNFDPDGGGQYNATHAWRGAYVPGPIGADPWGNRYAVNVEYLARDLGAGPSGNVNDVLVISAGNNSLIETRYDSDGASNGNDIVFVLSGGTR
jgi:type II secretory pathway pseudopilin PulG